MLATQLIEAWARQEGRASLYDWIVYKQESKARERKGEEEQRRLMFYAIFALRDRNLRQFASTVILSEIVWNCLRLSATIHCHNPPFSTSAVTPILL